MTCGDDQAGRPAVPGLYVSSGRAVGRKETEGNTIGLRLTGG